jgi:hypothetical protein
MAGKKTEDGQTPEQAREGRFYELQDQLAPARRGHYQLTPDIVLAMPTRRHLKAFRNAPDDESKIAALLGERYTEVDALFEDRPADEWLAFQRDYYDHFFGAGAAALPGGS